MHLDLLAKQAEELRWLRIYKLISVIAFIAVAIPAFELLTSWGTGPWSSVISVILVPLLISLGYGVHTLILLVSRRQDPKNSRIDFSFENSRLPIPLPLTLLACGISAIISLFICGGISLVLSRLLGNAANEIGLTLFMISGVIVSILGAWLTPMHFNHLCSIRTMIEFLAGFAAVFGIRLWWLGRGVGILFTVCVLVYVLSLLILMNQEYVIKPSYYFSTCHATKELRKRGISSAVKLFLASLGLTVVLLGLASLFVTSIRFFIFSDIRYIFIFPFSGQTNLNIAIYIIGIIAISVISIGFISHWQKNRYKQNGLPFSKTLLHILNFIGRFVHSLLASLGFFRRFRLQKRLAKKSDAPHQHYVDTVSFSTPVGTSVSYTNFRAFQRHLKSINNVDEQFIYAYHALITILTANHVGIRPHHTPDEMAAIIKSKTTIHDIDELTYIFTTLVYGQNRHAAVANVNRLSKIIASYMK